MIRDALSGGRAPRAWQRGLARAAAPLGVLRRSVAWLAELARLRPRLREEPLLGSCFNELALEPFPPAEPKAVEARPAPSRPRLDDLPSRLRRSSTSEPGSLRERRQPPPTPRREEAGRAEREEGRARSGNARVGLPLGLDPQASREMLARLVGPPGPGVVETPQSVTRNLTGSRNFGASPSPSPRTFPPGHEPVAPSARREADRYPGGWRRPDVSGPGQVSDDGLGRLYGRSFPSFPSEEMRGGRFERRQSPLSRWSGRAAGRGAGGEGRRPPTPPEASGETPSPSLPRFAGEGAPSLPREASDLPAPWRLTLDGERASGEVLERWRTPGFVAPARRARPASPPGASSRNLPPPPREEAPPIRTRQPETAEPARQPPQDTTLLPPPPSLPPFLQMQGAGDGIARNPAPEVKTVLTPPAGPALPVGEDLDALASKIQRILDEEARRHGIPV